MPKQGKIPTLTGAASWLAILSAAFFWVWLDRGMFGSALLYSKNQGVLETSVVLLMISSIIGLAAVCVIVTKSHRISVWPTKMMLGISFVGVAGGLLCLVFRGEGDATAFYFGSALLGLAMGYQNVVWGLIAVSQGTKKTLLHISGAWGLSLFINLGLLVLPSAVESIVVMLLPLASAIGFLAFHHFQTIERFRISFEARPANAPIKGRKVFGIDFQFLLVILVFCGAFGFVCWSGPITSASSVEQDAFNLAIARCAVALVFFIVCRFFTMKQVGLLLRGALSIVAAGVVLLTIGVFASSMNEVGRILIAMGYSGFDILVWTLVSYYARPSATRATQVIAVAMIAEQVGITFGIATSVAVNRMGIDAFVASVFLAAMNYILLLACFALMKRYDSQPILSDGPEPASSLSDVSLVAVDRFAQKAHLTAREKEIARLLAEGRNVPYISEKLFVSENTVKSHVRHIYEKSGVHNRQEFLDELESIRTL